MTTTIVKAVQFLAEYEIAQRKLANGKQTQRGGDFAEQRANAIAQVIAELSAELEAA